MKISTILALLMAIVCFKDSIAFLDVPPPPCLLPIESWIAPQSILGDAFAPPSLADSPIVSSSLQMANTMALQINQVADATASLSVGESELLGVAAHRVLDLSGIFFID